MPHLIPYGSRLTITCRNCEERVIFSDIAYGQLFGIACPSCNAQSDGSELAVHLRERIRRVLSELGHDLDGPGILLIDGNEIRIPLRDLLEGQTEWPFAVIVDDG